MKKRLIRLDARSCLCITIDVVKVKRLGRLFREWLLGEYAIQAHYNFRNTDLPVVNGILDGSLAVPYYERTPHQSEHNAGKLPKNYLQISTPFYLAIAGMPCAPFQFVEKDGEMFVWQEFEEEGDYETV